jgi:hypothetical protein
MYQVEVNSLLGAGDWFATRDEALQFALGKGKILLAMPKDAVNPSDWALSILGADEMWSFRVLKERALTEDEHELVDKYLFDDVAV